MYTRPGVLAISVLDALRLRRIILPTLNVIERIYAETMTRANRQNYEAGSRPLPTNAKIQPH